jgi:hypothetical protein
MSEKRDYRQLRQTYFRALTYEAECQKNCETYGYNLPFTALYGQSVKARIEAKKALEDGNRGTNL